MEGGLEKKLKRRTTREHLGERGARQGDRFEAESSTKKTVGGRVERSKGSQKRKGRALLGRVDRVPGVC